MKLQQCFDLLSQLPKRIFTLMQAAYLHSRTQPLYLTLSLVHSNPLSNFKYFNLLVMRSWTRLNKLLNKVISLIQKAQDEELGLNKDVVSPDSA